MSGPASGRSGALLVAAAASLWGCWSICFKSAERANSAPLSSAVESAVVFAVMFAAMLPLALRTRATSSAASSTSTTPRPTSAWAWLFLLGITDAINALAFFQAMQTTTVAIAVLSHYLAPLLVALFAPLVLGERARPTTFVALGVALFGLVLLLGPWSDVDAHAVVGAGLGALSAVFYAANVFIGKRLFAPGTGFNSFEVAAWPKLSSLALLVGAAVYGGGFDVDGDAFAILVVGGLLCGALPTVLFYAGLQRITASKASVLTLMEPMVAVIVGVVVWREELHLLGVVGGVCVLAGAALIARDA
jgi:drug/metabolite transporter (DMT)-like permease